MKTRNLLFLSIIMAASIDAAAQGPDALSRACNEIKRYEAFASGQIAFLATDIKTGEEIVAFNPDMSVIPASNTKLFSTAAALDIYGPEYRYKTEVLYTGKLDSTGRLNGDIIIRGSGDPTLGSRFFTDHPNYNYNELFIKAIREAGIRHIAGNIVGDGTAYAKEMTPPTWSWEDIGNYFGAVPNGLTAHDNLVTLHFKTGREGSEAIYTYCDPEIEGLQVLSQGVSSNVSREGTNTFGKSYQNFKYVQGPMPMNRTDITVRSIMPDPPLFVATQLRDSLNARGISVFGKSLSAADNSRYANRDGADEHLILTLESPTLAEIIQKTNLFSINLFAEHCLALVGLKQAKTTDITSASWALMAWWKSKGMNIKGMSINDGSGLSHYNIVTPRQLCYVLTYMRNTSKYYTEFNNSLTMCGGLGTMGSMCAGTRAVNNARGKSGTIRRVKSYSGYVKSRSGRELAFSIVINNFTCSSSETRTMMEKYIAALADYNR
ncbi:MAG: D-alanyl-D-alanine carboxypeptidase/D-alanyl-D-alanine-endopeptidase [Bacteroidales bacterium]|nr:D-alanyl-D-alanine carboxypeptidase/D-alanyl-D-alanine-endopeptidase [Bacteroidales bacterium]